VNLNLLKLENQLVIADTIGLILHFSMYGWSLTREGQYLGKPNPAGASLL
jgi:hypothetical protein